MVEGWLEELKLRLTHLNPLAVAKFILSVPVLLKMSDYFSMESSLGAYLNLPLKI